MDVNKDGQRLAARDGDKDIMDTPVDGGRNNSTKGKGPDEVMSKIAAAAATAPASVLERPREDKEEGAQRSTQMPSTSQNSHLPPLTQNLISLFGLQPLAATVARTDPVTGEKNKMRKSYENQIKTLGLAGRNKSVKHEEGKGMGLRELTLWPEEEWQNQKVMGKDIQKGLPTAVMAKLEKAMQMQPGPVPDNNKWEDLLGHDKPKPIEQNARNTKLPNNTGPKLNGQANGAATTAEANRPRRSSKKRRYDEQSFEGYGEGYVDDELDLGGYTSGETQFSRRSNSNKKRKKDYGPSPTGYGDRTASFSSGMVGVSAYGR